MARRLLLTFVLCHARALQMFGSRRKQMVDCQKAVNGGAFVPSLIGHPSLPPVWVPLRPYKKLSRPQPHTRLLLIAFASDDFRERFVAFRSGLVICITKRRESDWLHTAGQAQHPTGRQPRQRR